MLVGNRVAEEQVIRLRYQGYSSRRIARALASQGIKTSHSSVCRFLKKRARGKELSTEQFVDACEARDDLDRKLRILSKDIDRLDGAGELRLVFRRIQEYRKLLSLKADLEWGLFVSNKRLSFGPRSRY